MIPKPFDRLPQSAVRQAHFAMGSHVFRQDNAARGPCWVASGRVDLVRYTEAGTAVLLHHAVTGETLAEASLFSPVYHCDAIAAEDSEVAMIDNAAVTDMVRTDPAFALDLLARLAGQVQGYRRRLELLAIRPARDRVLAALADQPCYGTVLSLAAGIGLTHEATYRALSRLVAEGKLVKVGRGQYWIATAP